MSYFRKLYSKTPGITLAIFILLAITSCHKNDFKISGTISDVSKGDILTLEKSSPDGGWFAVDSVSLPSSGKFKFYGEAPAAPEIMRLRFKDQYIYLPVDSTDHINISAKGNLFATDFTLSGSENAANMERFEKELLKFGPYYEIPDSMRNFKRRIYTKYIKDSRASILSYYVLTKTIGGKALFGDEDDYKYFAAVATAYSQYRPDDPRTDMLSKISTEALRRRNSAKGNQRVLQARESAMVEITLPDTSGKMVSLSSLLTNGHPTVVVFANTTGDASKEIIRLRQLYTSKGINIYHIGFDADHPQWRQAASNLPWVTVWAGDAASANKVTADYNVNSLPTYFIYDKAGQLAARAENFEALASSMSAY